MYIIATAVLCIAFFAVGVLVGIKDCKRTFDIPTGYISGLHDGEGLIVLYKEAIFD